MKKLTVTSAVVAGVTVLGLGLAHPVAAEAAGGCTNYQTRHTNTGDIYAPNCPIWKTHTPVYAGSNTSTVVGYLEQAGNANWFECQFNAQEYRAYGYRSTNWAVTEADNGRWGVVPAVYYAGAADWWEGLGVCD